jgi:curli biogenesis system outer membrane secretion channel CsgG
MILALIVRECAMRVLIVFCAALLMGGCAGSSATVVKPAAGPSIAAAQAAPAQGPQRRIAVSGFDARAGGGAVGRGMSDMLVAALFDSGRFIVLERERLDEVTAEQDLGNSGRFRQDTVAPRGELEGAELLVRGAITVFEPDCKGASVLIASTRQACVTLNLRIIDAATGRIVNATTVEGNSVNRGVGFLYARSDLPIGLGAYSNTPMEQAIRAAIDAAVAHIVNTRL